MNTQEFNKSFEVDDSARRGVRAKAKGSAGFGEALTADGKPFDAEQTYFFFDSAGHSVRSSAGMRRQDAEWLSAMGFKVVQINKLRSVKSDALADGQDYFRARISEFEKLVGDFEAEKVKE
jgi:hypothetical protein